MNPGVDADNVRNYYENIQEVRQIDERTVKFVFDEPYWKSIEVVGLFEVLPKHIYQFTDPAEFNKHRSEPVGSGPYVFEKWDVGREVVLRRNENYWAHKPKLDRIVYRFISNDLAAVQALRSHEIDMMIPTPDQFAEFVTDKQFNEDFRSLVYWNPGIPYFYIGWNQATPFFKDPRVRLAMTHVVNREAIVKHLLKGNGKIITGPFYINGPQNDPNIEPWPYDLERARQLLDEAGWHDTDGDGIRDKDGTAFRFRYSIVSGNMLYERLAKLFKDDAAKVGVDVIADPLEWSVFIEQLNQRKFEAATAGWGGAIMEDPYQIWHSSQIEGRGSNRIGFSNAEADGIMEEARRTMDDEKRNALYYHFHRILHEEQPYTFLFTRPTFRFLDRRFENVKIHKLGLNELEWYVPKDKQRYK
jgi:peptide/nickel transport system substrate-binding protein